MKTLKIEDMHEKLHIVSKYHNQIIILLWFNNNWGSQMMRKHANVSELSVGECELQYYKHIEMGCCYLALPAL